MQTTTNITTNATIPPAGRDENDQPYWIVNGNRVYWQEMQKLLAASQSATPVATGKGVEQLPAMPVVDFESHVSIEMPATPEAGGEKVEDKAEDQGEVVSSGPTTVAADTTPSVKQASTQTRLTFVGDSPDIPNIASTPMSELPAKAEEMMKEPPSNAGHFLGTNIVRWLTQMIS